MLSLDRIAADVAVQKNVTDSVLTLLSGLVEKLKAVQPADPAVQAQLDAIAADLEANTARLTDAVTANTPAA